MAIITARYTSIPGTEAAEGQSDGRTVVADRPDGVAGGQGRGFSGGQLFALAVGACLCNDLRYLAHRRVTALGAFGLAVAVHVDDHGDIVHVEVEVDGGEEREAVEALLDEAVAASTIVRAVRRGAPVDIGLA